MAADVAALCVESRQLPTELRQKACLAEERCETKPLLSRTLELSLGSLSRKAGPDYPHEIIPNNQFKHTLQKSLTISANEYRVRDVTQKMQDRAYDHITLLGMAYDAGFNSKATFIRAFKQLTGKNPAEYKRELEKEVSTYHLQPGFQPGQIILAPEVPKWSHGQLNYHAMFRNYLKIAFRSFWKRKVFTFINIVGLSIGISASLVIYLIVNYDFTFDKFEKDSDRLYRVVSNFKFRGNEGHAHGVASPDGRRR